jgi:hypothetical protein
MAPISLLLVLAPLLQAKAPAAAEPSAALARAFDTAHLEQLAAPVALLPDPLLAQVLMASTYPVEVVDATRWILAHPVIAGPDLEKALQDQTWDPSVKSLCGFPKLLTRFCQDLDWYQDLGDALLQQKAELLAAIQTMRRKAYDAANLASTRELAVKVRDDKLITLDTTDPELVYVPVYYSKGVYGVWNYPQWYYPTIFTAPRPGQSWFAFDAGVGWTKGLWSSFAWTPGGGDVQVDVARRNAFIDRTEPDSRRQPVKDRVGNDAAWRHDPAHRHGVGYRNPRVAKEYGGSANNETRVAREVARGQIRPVTPPPPAKTPAQIATDAAAEAYRKGYTAGAYSNSTNANFERYSSYRGGYSRQSFQVYDYPRRWGWRW